ncbi:MAG: ABC transporter permease [Andreesenia angusta]|nr:ABC transporter permease [Andreesenia angusta]
MLDFWIKALEQGLIYGILVMGVYITYSILDFPDLSVDGTFPLGAAVTAVCIVSGMNPYLAMIISILAGLAAGLVTGLLHVKLGITNLLSGILVMTGLYSVNLIVMGKPNTPLLNDKTIFPQSGTGSPYTVLITIIILTIIVKLILDWYLSTKSGYMLKATGDNDQLVTSLGVSKGKVKIIGVMISNGLVALSGSIMAQYSKFADAQMGVGTIVIGLASIIIGISLFGRIRKVKPTTAVILGAVIYRVAIGIALKLNMPSENLKLITAIIVIIFLAINNKGIRFKRFFRKDKVKGTMPKKEAI